MVQTQCRTNIDIRQYGSGSEEKKSRVIPAREKELGVSSALLQRKIDDLNLWIPTGAATAAGIALMSGWTAVSTGRSFVLVRRDGAYRQAIVERRRSIHEVGGVSDAEIRGNPPAHSAICLDGLVLPGWKPEFHARQVLADTNNVAKVLDAL